MKNNKFYIVIGLLIFIGIIFYFGLLGNIKITEKNAGPFKVVSETYIGDYDNTREIQNRISQDLLKYNITIARTFGIYYDNPKQVDKNKLRSESGIIIDEKDYNKIEKIKENYNIKEIPKTKSIVTTFPYRNKYSISLGLFKVYPKINQYIEDKNYKQTPAMEIYDLENQQIIYLFEIVE